MARILIIEDDPATRVLVKKIFRSSDITVLEAENGAEGLSLAFEHEPDLILCDIMMPVMDGMEFLREWAANQTISQIPVVMVTSATEKHRVIKAVSLGARDYVVKPFDPLGLRAKVAKLLKEAIARRKTFPTHKERPLVLLASQEDSVRHQASEALAEDCEVFGVADGVRCLHLVTERSPDLLLLSSRIPLVTSQKVIAEIKNNDETDKTRIVLLGSAEELAALDEGLGALLAGTIEVPFSPETLRETVVCVLERDHYYFFDERATLVLRFQPRGLAAVAADKHPFDKRLCAELLELLDKDRSKMVVDLRALEGGDAEHFGLLKELFDAAASQNVKVRFKVAASNAFGTLEGLDIPREQISLEQETAPTSA